MGDDLDVVRQVSVKKVLLLNIVRKHRILGMELVEIRGHVGLAGRELGGHEVIRGDNRRVEAAGVASGVERHLGAG